MYRIYKYTITREIVREESITLPYGATILSAVCQYDTPILYCLIDPEEIRTEKRSIIVRGTGWDIDNETVDMLTYQNFNYLGTIQQYDGELMWHIWVK